MVAAPHRFAVALVLGLWLGGFPPLAAAQAPPGIPPPVPDPFAQDDAGCGCDAGNGIAEALAVNVSVFRGELLTVPPSPLAGPHVFDNEDWYQYHVDAGERITFRVTDLDQGPLPPVFQVIRPGGQVMSSQIAGTTPDWFIADEAGMWKLRVFAWTNPQAFTDGSVDHYEVTLERSPAALVHGGFSDRSYVVLGFDVPETGTVTGEIRVRTGALSDTPIWAALIAFKEDNTRIGGSAAISDPVGEGLYVAVGGQAIASRFLHGDDVAEVPTGLVDEIFNGSRELTRGRVYVALMSTGDYAYTSYDLTLSGGATFLGATSAPLGQEITRRQSDYQGDVNVFSTALTAQSHVSTTVPIRHKMLGWHDCDTPPAAATTCHATAPDGTTYEHEGCVYPQDSCYDVLISDARGDWVFDRDLALATGGADQNLVFAVDAILPEPNLGPGHGHAGGHDPDGERGDED